MDEAGDRAVWEIGWIGLNVEDAPSPFGSDDYPADESWEPFAVTQADQGVGRSATIWFRRRALQSTRDVH